MTFTKLFNEFRKDYPEQPRKVVGLLARCILGVESAEDLEHHCKSQPVRWPYMIPAYLTSEQAAWILKEWRDYEFIHQFDWIA